MNKLVLIAALALQAAAVPLLGMDRKGVVAGEYALLMRKNVTDEVHSGIAQQLTTAKTSKIGAEFRAIFAKLSSAELQWVLTQDHAIELVEPNLERHPSKLNCPAQQGEPVSWGQVRTTVPSAGDVVQVFAHDPNWGQGVDIYVTDTGILCAHEDFGGRCRWGTNTIDNTNSDTNGHGTHCASTAAGSTYGIAKSAQLIAVKVLGNGGGTIQSCIEGYEWSAAQAVASGRPSVVSVSLGGGYSAVENSAVNACVALGLTFSIASGNSNGNACLESPASAESCISVGSTELGNQGGFQVDAKSPFSNHGTCVDIFAPGSAITAAYIPNTNSYSTLSGTSMACPHVTGVAAALYTASPSATPAQIKASLNSMAIEGSIVGLPANTVNRMLHLQC